jgi:hypothetical protein
MADFSVDLRPRLIFHAPGGDVVLVVDPSSPTAGAVEFPMLGAIPYTIEAGIPTSYVHLSVPLWGDVSVPVNPFSGSGNGVIAIPGLGDVPYEIALGPQAQSATSGLFGGNWLLPALLIGGIFLLLRRR